MFPIISLFQNEVPQTLKCGKTKSPSQKTCSCFKINFTITKMFQLEFHYPKRRATQVSESMTESQSVKFLLQNQCHGHNQIGTIQEQRMFEIQHTSKTGLFQKQSKIIVKEHIVFESGVSKITIKTNLFRITVSTNTIKKQFALFQTQTFP